MLPTLALGLWAVQLGGDELWRVPLLFVAAALAGAAGAFLALQLPGGATLLPACMLALGACAALAARLPLAICAPLAIVAGLAVGNLTAIEARAAVQRPLLYLSGVPVGLGIVLIYIVGHLPGFIERLPWLRIASRVVGSWIAATGLLVLVLALAAPRPPP